MKKLRFTLTALIVLSLLCVISPSALAGAITVTNKYGTSTVIGSDEFCVKYNGKAVTFPDVQPFVDGNNRTLVPVRFVAETMGATVAWNKDTQSAVMTLNDITVKVPIGSDQLTVTQNGNESTIKMDTSAVNKDSRIFVPIRYVAEALGAWVGYSDLFNTVEMYKDVLTAAEIDRLHGYYDSTMNEYLNATGQNIKGAMSDEERQDIYPEFACFTGANGFNNANEWKLRNPNGIEVLKWASLGYKQTSYVGVTSGLKYTYGAQPDIDFAHLILAEARGVEKEINGAGKVTISLRTDLSCIYSSRHGSSAGTYVRGVLTVNIPTNADLSWIASHYDFISNPKAGEIRNVDVEIYVNTFTSDVHWSVMTALS